jgi:hypothetical protein
MWLHQIRSRRRCKCQPQGATRKRQQQNPLQRVRLEPLEDAVAVLLWYLSIEAQTLDAGLFEPGFGNVQCKSPRGEDNTVSLRLGRKVAIQIKFW